MLIIGLIYAFLTYRINGESQAQMTYLHNYLINNYKNDVVPRIDDKPIQVNITFYLMSLIRFDETEETLVSAAWLSISWRDQFLMWSDNTEYENITDIYLNQKYIWKPDIMLINTVDDFEILGSDNRLAEVTSDGGILWEPGHRFQSTCSPNINNYPFDTQECILKFSTWTHVASIVILDSESNEIILDDFEENGEWKIITSSVVSRIFDYGDYSLPEFIVTLTLQRRRTYYVLTVCVPIIVLSILNCLVYLLPPGTGEKMSFSLTTLLSYMVYISFLSDNLPRTSKTISYLLVYLCLMIGLSFVSVLNSVIVLMFWYRSDYGDTSDTDDAKHHAVNKKSNDKTVAAVDHESQSKHIVKGWFCKTSRIYPFDDGNQGSQHRHWNHKENRRRIAERLDKVFLTCVVILVAIATIVVLSLLLQ